jgi:hypothetical protein
MDWTPLWQFAGDKGPFLFIMAAQLRIITMFARHHFEQQKVLLEAMRNSQRAIEHVERNTPGDV